MTTIKNRGDERGKNFDFKIGEKLETFKMIVDLSTLVATIVIVIAVLKIADYLSPKDEYIDFESLDEEEREKIKAQLIKEAAKGRRAKSQYTD